jgi:glycosyltransferase involved in cell wall biosynthesis
MAAMARVLVLGYAPLPAAGRLTPGSGVRQYEMARALARAGLNVSLLSARLGDPIDGVETVEFGGAAPTSLPPGFDAYVVPVGYFGAGAERPAAGLVVVDAYDQSLFSYARRDADTPEGRVAFESRIHEVASALIEADVVLHAGAAARHALLGMLSLLGRVAPGHADPADDLLDVPLGAPPPLPSSPPVVTDPPLPAGAETVLWPSGTYVFFDAERALAAFEIVAARRPAAHLLVAGGVAPGAAAADRANFERFVALAKASPAASRIRFVDWTPYAARGALYAAARVAVVLTRPGPEDELSWRNRVVDAVAAGLPTVIDGESESTRIVAAAGAGVAVERSVEAAAAAIESLLASDARHAACTVAARSLAAGPLSWDACVAPLVARIGRGSSAGAGLAPAPIPAVRLRRRRWGTALHRLEVSLRLRGPAGFVAHGLRRAAGRRGDAR